MSFTPHARHLSVKCPDFWFFKNEIPIQGVTNVGTLVIASENAEDTRCQPRVELRTLKSTYVGYTVEHVMNRQVSQRREMS